MLEDSTKSFDCKEILSAVSDERDGVQEVRGEGEEGGGVTSPQSPFPPGQGLSFP